jgi:hydroxymethylpyrimidine pyrophosphatase-like HAD family hydrolase
MGVPSERLVAVGSEASDVGFLEVSGFPVATADASEIVKRRAKLVTRGSSGDGVIELIDEIVRDDLRQVASSLPQMSWTRDLSEAPQNTWG